MGMIHFLRQMIPNFAEVAHPVAELLRQNPSAKPLQWTDAAKTSFDNLKHALLNCHTLAYPLSTSCG